jgi:hypothetical protein
MMSRLQHLLLLFGMFALRCAASNEAIVPLQLRHVLLYQEGALLVSVTNHSWNTTGRHEARIALPRVAHLDSPQPQITRISDPLVASASNGATVVRSKLEIASDSRVQQQQQELRTFAW